LTPRHVANDFLRWLQARLFDGVYDAEPPSVSVATPSGWPR